MLHKKFLFTCIVSCIAGMTGNYGLVSSADWPMYRSDSGRRGVVESDLPEELTLVWNRRLPALTPAFQDERLQFDAGYEPVIADETVLLASSLTDSVMAFNSRTGESMWTFYTNGPVRLAPSIDGGLACFGSDDGYLYCVEVSSGRLRWKHRAVPSGRRLLGNRRLISVWPIRGGPVVEDGVVYFAAGVWPFEGVFVYAMEMESGKVLWRNDRMGYMYGTQPHNTEAIGGLAPQGYLLIEEDELIVPCSNAYPARLKRDTGELVSFELPSAGRYPGGWFAAIDLDDARAVRRGKLTFDEVVNRQVHEDGLRSGDGGKPGLSRMIRIGDRVLEFDDPPVPIEGVVHSMAVADNHLYVTTREGELLCFGGASDVSEGKPVVWSRQLIKPSIPIEAKASASRIVEQVAGTHGIALVIGLQNGDLVDALIDVTNFHVIAFDDDPGLVAELRARWDASGLYGQRVVVHEVDLSALETPPYIATVMTSENQGGDLVRFLQSLRPYGGVSVGGRSPRQSELDVLDPGGFEIDHSAESELVVIRRDGALPGSTEYKGGFTASDDELVRFPLGVLWFDDTLAHFKRSPQPVFDRGTMISRPKDWMKPRNTGNYKIDYPLLPVVLSDIYTGRVLKESERVELRGLLEISSPETLEPSQYRPTGEPFSSKSTPRVAGQRINPLTGVSETRVFPKTYGCDGGVDYGAFYTLRSGTAAFYDKTIESGTVFLSGPRSGCTNSIIPSGGILNVPYFYEGCTCSYPLPTAMSLVAMPERFEQWSSWGKSEIAPGSLQRLGINFGAPGDRMTRAGTLWLDYPSVGGPSPGVRVESQGTLSSIYRHSLFINPDDPFPWVSGSAVKGLQSLIIRDLKPGNYEVNFYFCRLQSSGQKSEFPQGQTIRLQGIPVSGGTELQPQLVSDMQGIVHSVRNVLVQDYLQVELSAQDGETMISGLELIRQP